MHTHELQPIQKSTGATKIGEECAEDMHKGQCGYQVPPLLFPVVKRNRPAVHVLYSEFPANFSLSEN